MTKSIATKEDILSTKEDIKKDLELLQKNLLLKLSWIMAGMFLASITILDFLLKK